MKDKIHHIVYSYAICLTLCLLFEYIKNISLYVFIVTIAIGIVKELYDRVSKTGKCDFKDFIADFAGIVLGLAVFNICI
jgi:hypothetical protein